ncbi:MAG: SPOR domain-containing protein [Alphaproteobacteria bacterium]
MTTKFLSNFLTIIVACIVACLSVFSCSSSQEKPKVRIVDLKGNAKPVLTKVPEFNARVLEGSDTTNSAVVNKASEEQQSTTILPENRNVNNKTQYVNQQLADTAKAPVLNSVNANNNSDPVKSKEKTNMIFAGRGQEKSVAEYDLANSRDEVDDKQDSASRKDLQASNKKTDKKDANQNNKSLASSSKKYFVQTGSYTAQEVADQELKEMRKFAKGKVEKVEMTDRITYRVLLGPYTNKAQARKMVNKVVNSGHEAILVKDQ